MSYNINYKRLYIKYKSKYINLKKTKHIQTGGSLDLYINTINDFIIKIEKQLELSKNTNSENELDKSNLDKQIYKNVELLKKYVEKNDIPVEIVGYPYFSLNELEESIIQIKNNSDEKKIKDNYNLRRIIYSIDDTNYEEILDIIIGEFNINNPIDIEKIFSSSVLGYDKNNIIGFLVLFRLLLKNNIQLSTIDNNISYLTTNSIYNLLDNSNNIDEYNSLLIKLINQYIKSNPIKKIIKITKIPELEDKHSVIPEENNYKNKLIYSYDSINNLIIYKYDIVKHDIRADLDDIKQIINSIFKIKLFRQ